MRKDMMGKSGLPFFQWIDSSKKPPNIDVHLVQFRYFGYLLPMDYIQKYLITRQSGRKFSKASQKNQSIEATVNHFSPLSFCVTFRPWKNPMSLDASFILDRYEDTPTPPRLACVQTTQATPRFEQIRHNHKMDKSISLQTVLK